MAGKIKCPKCGAENYATDPMCLNCGADMKAPPPAKPKADVADPMAAPAAPATPAAGQPGAGKPSGAELPPASPPSPLMPWIRVILVTLGLTLLEMVILSATSQGKYPSVLWHQHIDGALPLRIVVWTLIFGGMRVLLIGGLVYLTGWSSTVSLLVGGALGWTTVGTIPGGVVIGFIIGLLLEGHKAPTPTK